MMTDASEFVYSRPIDWARLNGTERRVLQLLAEGHTAKSIATELDTTAAAINERLREARRKTGVGSSRELARLLKAQESRDDLIGVGEGVPQAERAPSSNARSWRFQTGVVAMLSMILTVAAGSAALMSQAAPQSKEVDPLLGTQLPSGPDPATLHAKVRAESKDAAWARPMEKALNERARQIPLIGKGGNALRVTCAASLCEIAGTIEWPGSPPKDYDPKLPQNQAQQALQADPFNADLKKLGLRRESGFFTGAKGEPSRMVFLLYYVREGARH